MHYLIYVHGMGDKLEPTNDYEDLKIQLIKIIDNKKNKDYSTENFKHEYIYWEELIHDKEEKLLELTFPEIPKNKIPNFLTSPIKIIRYFFTYFLGDAIAYTSENESTFRNHFFTQIKDFIQENEFSFISHSLGSVITMDFLFNLLTKNSLKSFHNSKIKLTEKSLNKIKNNFKGLYSFGSPIALFLLRKFKLFPNVESEVTNFFKDNKKWFNFYYYSDPIAYPVKNIFNNKNIYKYPIDIKLINMNIFLSHIFYWKNEKMAKIIAHELLNP